MTNSDPGPDEIVRQLLNASVGRGLCVLDSCGVGKPGSNRMIAGLDPVRVMKWKGVDPDRTLEEFERLIDTEEVASVFTVSYEFGAAVQNVTATHDSTSIEPDIFVAQFDSLLVHDYEKDRSDLLGPGNTRSIRDLILKRADPTHVSDDSGTNGSSLRTNLGEDDYIRLITEIQEQIRSGETYQTNLTQQMSIDLSEGQDAAAIFDTLRQRNPAPFSAYIDREDSYVVSASPELFFAVKETPSGRRISTSPIKGTRPRGITKAEDDRLRRELSRSAKDRAENTMIVDLMRNDLGRICDFGTVMVSDLCIVEDHPTLFQSVSTVEGMLRDDVGYADILRVLFPCGSITGAPKLRTMEIIDRLEPDPRGLSMGAIGCRIPKSFTGAGEIFEASVAIRTIVIRDGTAVFNVGGGIVIDSDPVSEYEESLLKAKALLNALGSSVD